MQTDREEKRTAASELCSKLKKSQKLHEHGLLRPNAIVKSNGNFMNVR